MTKTYYSQERNLKDTSVAIATKERWRCQSGKPSWRKQQMNGDLEENRKRLPETGAREKHSRQKEQQDAEADDLVQAMPP